MMYAQFLRIETHAGGAASSNRSFIRSARALLSVRGRSRAQRPARHAWVREGLALRNTVAEFSRK